MPSCFFFFFFFFLFVYLTTTTSAMDFRARRALLEQRFLISQQDDTLCITAPSRVGKSLTLQKCDFTNRPRNQLWRQDDYEFINDVSDSSHSSYCIMVGTTDDIFDGVRIRMGECKQKTTEFVLDNKSGSDGNSGALQILGSQLCLTSQGNTAQVGDNIIAKKCRNNNNRSDFQWAFSSNLDNSSLGGTLYELYAGDGFCVQPKDGVATSGNSVVLRPCPDRSPNLAWYVPSPSEDDIVSFSSAIDVNYCLQAGFSSSAPRDGTKMRLLPCDATEPLQQFYWYMREAPIQLANNNRDLCMVVQGGRTSLEDGDALIMKKCAVRRVEW